MIGGRPSFIDSPYFVMEEDNWHLKEGAPAELVKEFNDYMNSGNELMEGSDKPVKKSMTTQIDDMLKLSLN